jgi:hypothetical protein
MINSVPLPCSVSHYHPLLFIVFMTEIVLRKPLQKQRQHSCGYRLLYPALEQSITRCLREIAVSQRYNANNLFLEEWCLLGCYAVWLL